MKHNDHVLYLAADGGNQLFLHADAKGLDLLIASLQGLKQKVAAGKCDHDHLMTEAWAGDGELTEDEGCEKEGRIIHHLKVYAWTDEWSRKHGFIKDDK